MNLGRAVDPRGAPDAPAIVDLLDPAAPRTFSYAAFDAACDAAGRGLLRRGLPAGSRIAILSGNRVEVLVWFMGAMRAGLVAVPINHKLPAATVAFVLRDCDARLALADAARAALCPPDLPCVLLGTPDEDALADPGPLAPLAKAPDAAAMFLYTSGSTGRPKGVVLSHASHLWVLQQRMRPAAAPRERWLVAAPLYHMNALAVCQSALAQGDTVILLPGFTALSYIDAIDAHRPTALTSVPTMMAMLLREPARLARADLASVRSLRMGSAPVSPALVDGLRRWFPTVAMTNGYGTTEAGPVVFAPHPDGRKTPPLSVGVRHPAVDLRLAGGEDEGVLEMRCPALMIGYHNLPEATARAMTADGFYVTGDVFRRDADGFFYFVGRADDMFVSGGENVYPGEVEKMLETHPAIRQAAVVPIDDELKGQKPVAFVVADPAAGLSEAEVRAYALAHAAPYLHPRRVWFLDELPLAGTNKIDRRALAEMAARGGDA